MSSFNPDIAFSRTLGFVTREEAKALRQKTVAIAGLGGAGGTHLLTLTRLGIENFHIADFDHFELDNFNRQAGSQMETIGRSKVAVMEQMARQINPDIRIRAFSDGVTAQNLSAFLDGVDIYVDGLDYFAFDMRPCIFEACRDKNIPAITVAPLGMGAALLNFLPGHTSFHEYFDWHNGDSDLVKAAKFAVGLAPSLAHRHYLVDKQFVNLAAHRGPSTPMGVELCAGVAGSEVLKIFLHRGPVSCAPRSLHFDAYLNRYYQQTVWFGNRNPIQKLKIAVFLRMLGKNA